VMPGADGASLDATSVKVDATAGPSCIDGTFVYMVRIGGAACTPAYMKKKDKLILSNPHKRHMLSFP
jgi:hypothetical protein